MAVRLRYLAHDLEVPPGQFVIGRTADCQLSLDDPLVSRRHALLTVRGDSAVIEDLGSRNGVLLNGTKIDRPNPLRDGDVIKVGGQELTLSGLTASSQPVIELERARTESRMMTLADRADLDAPDEEALTTLGTSPFYAPPSHPDKRVHALSLIGGVADKALAMGRIEEAEKILSRALTDVLVKARAGNGEVTRDMAEVSANYALRLAGATTKGTWIEYALELYSVLDLVLPGRLVDELYGVVRKVKHIDKAVLRTYVARLRQLAAGFGPADRFIQQRIEGLERWAP